MGIMLAALTVITFGIILWSLWTRRHTWRVRWETASTTQVTLMGIAAVLLTLPHSIENLLDPWLHSMTHVWNLQFWFAHLCVLGSACAIVYNAVSRLDRPGHCPDEPFHRWFVKWIQIPTGAGVLLMTALFTGSRAARYDYPHFAQQKPVGPYTQAYWVVFSLLLLYLMVHGIRAFRDLYDESGRGLIRIYMAASLFSVVTLLLRIMLTFVWYKPMDDVMEVCGMAAMSLFAFGAGWSWIKRVRWFGGRDYHVDVHEHDGEDGGKTFSV